MTDHDWLDDVGAYLLGALDDEEREAFERELERSPQLRAEVAHLQVAADALPASPEPLSPPPELKDRVMAVVNAEADLLRSAAPEPRRRRRAVAVLRSGWWSMRPGLAVAASVLVLALGGGAALLGQSVLGGGGGGGGERQRTFALGEGKLIQRESGHSTLTVSGLRPPGPGRVYQVWLQRKGGEPEPTNALFSARADGTASVDVPGSLKHVESVLVTSEPEGGSQTPTTRPVIVAHPA